VSGGEPRERWDALDLDAFPSPSRRGTAGSGSWWSSSSPWWWPAAGPWLLLAD